MARLSFPEQTDNSASNHNAERVYVEAYRDGWGFQYMFPKELLVSVSDYFKKCLEGEFKEAGTRVVKMEDVSPETMRSFATWLFQGFKGLEYEAWPAKDQLCHFVDLIIFGDRIPRASLQNEAMAELNMRLCRQFTIDKLLCLTEGILVQLPENHPCRRLLASTVAYRIVAEKRPFWPSEGIVSNVLLHADGHADFIAHFGERLCAFKLQILTCGNNEEEYPDPELYQVRYPE